MLLRFDWDWWPVLTLSRFFKDSFFPNFSVFLIFNEYFFAYGDFDFEFSFFSVISFSVLETLIALLCLIKSYSWDILLVNLYSLRPTSSGSKLNLAKLGENGVSKLFDSIKALLIFPTQGWSMIYFAPAKCPSLWFGFLTSNFSIISLTSWLKGIYSGN